MEKVKKKKLVLRKMSVAKLAEGDLTEVVGGPPKPAEGLTRARPAG